jgi:hypothetical protein
MDGIPIWEDFARADQSRFQGEQKVRSQHRRRSGIHRHVVNHCPQAVGSLSALSNSSVVVGPAAVKVQVSVTQPMLLLL